MLCAVMDLLLMSVFFVQVTQLEGQLDSEKKSHEHLLGAFKKVTSVKDELVAKNASLGEQLRVSPRVLNCNSLLLPTHSY